VDIDAQMMGREGRGGRKGRGRDREGKGGEDRGGQGMGQVLTHVSIPTFACLQIGGLKWGLTRQFPHWYRVFVGA